MRDYTAIALAAIAVGILISLFALVRMMQMRKKGAYGKMHDIIKDAKSALKRGDKTAATQYYVMLRHAIEKNKPSLSKRKFNRLYREAVKLHGKIVGK